MRIVSISTFKFNHCYLIPVKFPTKYHWEFARNLMPNSKNSHPITGDKGVL